MLKVSWEDEGFYLSPHPPMRASFGHYHPRSPLAASWGRVDGLNKTPPINATWSEQAPHTTLLEGWDSASVGEVSLSVAGNQVLLPEGGDFLLFGAPLLESALRVSWVGAEEYAPKSGPLHATWGGVRTGTLSPAGWDSLTPGWLGEVRNHTQIVERAGAIPPLQLFGDTEVWLYTRYLLPGGVFGQQMGGLWVSHWLRHILSPGSGDMVGYGAQWVSRSPRNVGHVGTDEMSIHDNHLVGGLRLLAAEGWSSQEFGSRIIPENQQTYPFGFSGESGEHDVQLGTRLLSPRTFETNPDDLRFGVTYVWNLRQYVFQDYDPNDSLNPPPFGTWSRVGLRDKYPAAFGWPSERFGYQFAWNKARDLHPVGIPFPDMGGPFPSGSVTHKVRSVPAGIGESLFFGRWLNTRNAAELVAPTGPVLGAFGESGLENASRKFERIGGSDNSAIGTPFVSDAIRVIGFRELDTMLPPTLPLPVVELATRYLGALGHESSGTVGAADLYIKWNIIVTRWGHYSPAWVGWAEVRNNTPELPTKGSLSEEFGLGAVRTQWRDVVTLETYATQWGRPEVRDRRGFIRLASAGPHPRMLPGPRVKRLGGLPDPQHAILPGIAPTPSLQNQVPKPSLNLLFAYPHTHDSLVFGDQRVHANSIRVEPGYYDFLVGTPDIGARVRQLTIPPAKGQMDAGEVARPEMGTLTVWAVVEAPQQAKINHPVQRSLHYVDYNPASGGSIKGVSAPTVSHKHRGVRASGEFFGGMGVGELRTTRLTISPPGNHSLRVPVPAFSGDRIVEQFESTSFVSVGKPGVGEPPYFGPVELHIEGLPSPDIEGSDVSHFHRALHASGWDALLLGERKSGDHPYMWQGLRIGPHVPVVVHGGDGAEVSEPWISNFVRSVSPLGAALFDTGHEVGWFHLRMRVWRPAPDPDPPLACFPTGLGSGGLGIPDGAHKVHHIFPDGDSEQFRKGGF